MGVGCVIRMGWGALFAWGMSYSCSNEDARFMFTMSALFPQRGDGMKGNGEGGMKGVSGKSRSQQTIT
jgi:hypothetical protein